MIRSARLSILLVLLLHIMFASTSVAAFIGRHVTLTGESAAGYSYSGTGVDGLPGTSDPDSRRRAKVYNDFPSFDASIIGNTLTMTYDILWGGDADPSNESQDWRFGFVSSTANGGKGVSLGANFDIGNLAGSTAYEFFTDASATSGEAGSGVMDSGFTPTLNGAGDGTARFAQSNDDPFSDDVAFNDRTDTHRVSLTLERITNGYDLSMSWQNLVSTNTITHSATITTSDFDTSSALAAGVTSWDRLGFYINDNNIDGAGPWTYSLSNVAVTGSAGSLALADNWSANEYQTVPEPGSLALAVLSLVAAAACNRRSQG